MMKRLKILALILGCLWCALALTACHTDPDPWPASQPAEGVSNQGAPQPTADTQNGEQVPWGAAQPENGATQAPADPDAASDFNG